MPRAVNGRTEARAIKTASGMPLPSDTAGAMAIPEGTKANDHDQKAMEADDEEPLSAPEAVQAICAILDDRDTNERCRILRATCVLVGIEADFDEVAISDDGDGG